MNEEFQAVNWYLDICMEAKAKNLVVVVDEYVPEYRVYDSIDEKRVLLGHATTLLDLHGMIYDHPREPNHGLLLGNGI